MRLLDGIGFESASDVTLKIDPSYEPVPDVIAVELPMLQPYPTARHAIS